MSTFIKNYKPYIFPKLGYINIPKFDIPRAELEELGLKEGSDNNEYLCALAKKGLEDKIKAGIIPDSRKQEYFDRLDFELNEVKRLRFTEYLILVFKVIQFCKKNDVLNGPGRGSCGGSCILFVIGVTSVDPIKYDLLFERFISNTRTEIKEIDGQTLISSSSCPDVDIDTDRSKKHLINEFIENQFPGRNAQIGTINSYQSKMLIKEILKSLKDCSEEQSKLVSGLIEVKFGKVEEIKHALDKNVKFKNWAINNTEVVQVAQKLNGLCKNKSIHASGIIICEQPVLEIMPLECGSGDRVSVDFDMDDAALWGIKLDNLGLKNLTSLKLTLDAVGLKIEDLNVDDPSVYEYLNNRNEFYGIFQAEEGLGKSVLKKIQPKCLEDISVSIALGRPGSLSSIDDFIKNDPELLEKLDERVKPVLAKTRGLLIYQEQILKLSQIVGGFTPQESAKLQKVISKKKIEEMPLYKEKFFEGGKKNGFAQELIEYLWITFEASGNYSFNACLCPENTIVYTKRSSHISEEKLTINHVSIGYSIKCWDVIKKEYEFNKVINIYYHKAILYQIKFTNGLIIECSLEHKFLTSFGEMFSIGLCIAKGYKIVTEKGPAKVDKYQVIGLSDCIDLEIDSKYHNFIANGIIVSNSHSTAYAILLAKLAYIKSKYPLQYMLSALQCSCEEQDPTSEIQKIQSELKFFNIKMLPPSIIKSGPDFKIEDGNIRFGLGQIKGVGQKVIEKINNFKTEYSNKFEIFKACDDSGVNSAVFCSLILVGALDSKIEESRSRIVLEWHLWHLLTAKEKIKAIELGLKYNYDLIKTVGAMNKEEKDIKGNPVIKDSRRETLKKNYLPYLDIYENNKKNERFAKFIYETKLLGFSYSTNLREIYLTAAPDLAKIEEVIALGENENVHFMAVVTEIKEGTSKAGNKYLRIEVKDETAEFRVMLLNDNIEVHIEDNGRRVKKDDIVSVRGKTGRDIVFAQRVGIQENNVAFKIRDLNK